MNDIMVLYSYIATYVVFTSQLWLKSLIISYQDAYETWASYSLSEQTGLINAYEYQDGH